MTDIRSAYKIASLLEAVNQEWGKFSYLPKFHSFYFSLDTVKFSVSHSLGRFDQASDLIGSLSPESRSEIKDDVLQQLDNALQIYTKLCESYPAIQEIDVAGKLDGIRSKL